jgi:zinc ribbon protein
MYCSKCGTENPETASYCSKCGARINLSDNNVEVKQEAKRSTLRLIGGVVALIAAVISICPFSLEMLIGTISPADTETEQWMMDVLGNSVYRMGFVLLIIVFAIVSLVKKSPSRIIPGLMILSTIIAIGLPYIPLFGTHNNQSLGGFVGSIFLLIVLVGNVLLLVDGFRKD